MKINFYPLLLMAALYQAHAQTPADQDQAPANADPVAPSPASPPKQQKAAAPPAEKQPLEGLSDDYNKNTRISFIVGLGPSGIITNNVYNLPSIDPTTGLVKLQTTSPLRTNISLGIVYTPYFKAYKYTNNSDWEIVPAGISYAAFFNPVKLSGIGTNQSFFNLLDMGLGIGWRTSGGVLFMLTGEFFSVKQPQKWFVEKYGNDATPYMLDGEIQKSINYDDDNVFYNKVVTTVGFKICYTFDVIKDYYKLKEEDLAKK